MTKNASSGSVVGERVDVRGAVQAEDDRENTCLAVGERVSWQRGWEGGFVRKGKDGVRNGWRRRPRRRPASLVSPVVPPPPPPLPPRRRTLRHAERERDYPSCPRSHTLARCEPLW